MALPFKLLRPNAGSFADLALAQEKQKRLLAQAEGVQPTPVDEGEDPYAGEEVPEGQEVIGQPITQGDAYTRDKWIGQNPNAKPSGVVAEALARQKERANERASETVLDGDAVVSLQDAEDLAAGKVPPLQQEPAPSQKLEDKFAFFRGAGDKPFELFSPETKKKISEYSKSLDISPWAAFYDKNIASTLADKKAASSKDNTVVELMKQQRIDERQQRGHQAIFGRALIQDVRKDLQGYDKMLPAFKQLEQTFATNAEGKVDLQKVKAQLSILIGLNGSVGAQTEGDISRQFAPSLRSYLADLLGFIDRDDRFVDVKEIAPLIQLTQTAQKAWEDASRRKIYATGQQYTALGADPDTVNKILIANEGTILSNLYTTKPDAPTFNFEGTKEEGMQTPPPTKTEAPAAADMTPEQQKRYEEAKKIVEGRATSTPKPKSKPKGGGG